MILQVSFLLIQEFRNLTRSFIHRYSWLGNSQKVVLSQSTFYCECVPLYSERIEILSISRIKDDGQKNCSLFN